MATNVIAIKPMPAIPVRRIALPMEHGSWGILLEPIVAGLAVAFSIGGFWIALMIIGAFLMRQPLKVLILDRKGMRDDRRAKVAVQYVVEFGIIFSVAAIASALTAGVAPLIPLMCVIPLAAVQTYYDVFRRSRDLMPELAGAVAISASVAAITIAGGLSVPLAIGIWMALVARTIPSILYVRERLLLEKGKKFSRALPIAAHTSAVVAIGLLAYFHLASVLTVFAGIFLLYRCVEGMGPARRPMKAMQIGVREVIYGVIFVLSIIIGTALGV